MPQCLSLIGAESLPHVLYPTSCWILGVHNGRLTKPVYLKKLIITSTSGLLRNPSEGKMAERTGLEPATPGVTGRYSNQLNYRSERKNPKTVTCLLQSKQRVDTHCQ